MEVITRHGTAPNSTRVTYIFDNDGSITVPFTSSARNSAKITSGKVAWPESAELANGRAGSTRILVPGPDIEGRKTHADAHMSRCRATEREVKVPAGT